MDWKSVAIALKRAGALPIIVIAAVVISVIVMNTPLANTLSPYQLKNQYTITVNLEGSNLFVAIKLPPPSAYYYGGYYGYYYYGYYGYYGYAVTGIPITVIVTLSKDVEGVPEIYETHIVKLVAYGTPNQANITFYNLEPGGYTLRVMFWNDLLAKLHAMNAPWIPLAYPYIKSITVGG